MPMISLWKMYSLGIPVAQFRSIVPAGFDEDGDPLYDSNIVQIVLSQVRHGCQWIDGDPHERDSWSYCSGPRVKGSAYCPEHLALSRAAEPGSKPLDHARGTDRVKVKCPAASSSSRISLRLTDLLPLESLSVKPLSLPPS